MNKPNTERKEVNTGTTKNQGKTSEDLGRNKHETLEAAAPPKPENITKSAQKVHEVEPGETLYGICKKYGIELAQLRSWNELGDSNNISSQGRGNYVPDCQTIPGNH